MALSIDIVLISVAVLNLTCHSMGSFFLISVYKKGRKTVQQILLINLSVTELVISLINLIIEVYVNTTQEIRARSLTKGARTSPLQFAQVARKVLFCSYYTAMIYITADRFFGVLLNIKYPIYWDTKKTKILLYINSCTIVVFTVVLTVIYGFIPFNYTCLFTLYVHSVFNVIVLLLCFTTYSYIFYRYTRRQVHPINQSAAEEGRSCGPCGKFGRSKFHLTFLLIASFLLLCVVPNMILWFVDGSNNFNSDMVEDVVQVFYVVSFLVDAMIFIFLNPLVKEELRKTVF